MHPYRLNKFVMADVTGAACSFIRSYCPQVSLGSVDTELLLESMFKVLKRCNGPAREFQRDKLSAGTWNHQAGQEYDELPARRQSALQVRTAGELPMAAHGQGRVHCAPAGTTWRPWCIS